MKNKAAQALGRLARGVPKSFSPEELDRRRKRMEALNEGRKKEKGKRKKEEGAT